LTVHSLSIEYFISTDGKDSSGDTVMGCWKWFDSILKEAEIEVTDINRDKIDEIIHQYIGEQSHYGRCSADWKKARKEIKADKKMSKELVKRLRSIT
jgi:hypothetical protein